MKNLTYLIFSLLILVTHQSYAHDQGEATFKDWQVFNAKDYVLARTLTKGGQFGKFCRKSSKECVFVLIVHHTCKENETVPILVSTDSMYTSMSASCQLYENNEKMLILPNDKIISHALDKGLIGFAIPELKSKFISSRFSLAGSNAAILNAADKAGLLESKSDKRLPLGTHEL